MVYLPHLGGASVTAVMPGAPQGAVGQVTDIDGEVYHLTDQSQREARIRRKQREKAQKQTGSVRSRHIRGQLRKLHCQGKRIRFNDTHHISRELADKAHTVVVEDPNTKAMTQSVQGTWDSGKSDSWENQQQVFCTFFLNSVWCPSSGKAIPSRRIV